MAEVVMPKLSDSMEEGTILTWLVRDGDPVTAGQDLVEIETDKASVTTTAETGGIVRLVAHEGTRCAVGEVIARIDGATAPGGAPEAGTRLDGQVAEVPATPPAGWSADGAALSGAAPVRPEPTGTGVREHPAGAVAAATPLARRAARTHGVTLAGVAGTGPRGRVTRTDVLAAAGVDVAPSSAASRAAPPASPPATPGANLRDRTRQAAAMPSREPSESRAVVPLTRPQQVVAERMALANSSVPAFQVQTEAALDAALELRLRLCDAAGQEAGPSINDLVVRAAALALREHPRANASFTGRGFEYHERVNVGLAVAVEGTLLVPTVFDADTKSLGALAADTRRLAGRARAGTITPAELSAGTFTVSNLGMYGMTAITPVVNPPQAAILGVGAARPVPRRVGEAIVDETRLTLTLSCDHRILYGADAARFLATIRSLLEAPYRLVL